MATGTIKRKYVTTIISISPHASKTIPFLRDPMMLAYYNDSTCYGAYLLIKKYGGEPFGAIELTAVGKSGVNLSFEQNGNNVVVTNSGNYGVYIRNEF